MSAYINRDSAAAILCEACGNAACPKGLIPRCSFWERLQTLPSAEMGAGSSFGLVWHGADWDLPATQVDPYEEDGKVYDILLSDPVLIADEQGDLFIAIWEEDASTGFAGWVNPHDGAVISDVKFWRRLPDPPEVKP